MVFLNFLMKRTTPFYWSMFYKETNCTLLYLKAYKKRLAVKKGIFFVSSGIEKKCKQRFN